MNEEIPRVCKGFKVVGLVYGKLGSATQGDKAGGVRYKVGKWIYPQAGCGPLAVFDTLENAHACFPHSMKHGWVRCYVCEYTASLFAALWCKYESDRYISRQDSVPPGTIFADKVRLIEVA